jgi:TRAP-type uncharacterized transport system substrate-binding protein
VTAPRRTPLPRRYALLLPLLAALLAGGASVAAAAPLRTALVAEQGDGSWRFLSDLAQLWRNRYEPTPEQLLVRAVPGALARLRAVSRGRGDFAVVDAATATAHLGDYPRLAAIAVLWPDLLHAVTRNPAVHELSLPVPAELWALDNAAFAYQTLGDLSRNDPAHKALLSRVPDDILPDALDYANGPIVLFTAPTPLRELYVAMGKDPRLQLLPIGNKLMDELKLAWPWLTTDKLERLTYPGQSRNLELPAVYEILVGRRDLPVPTVRKVLNTAYGSASAMALFDPLFGQVDGRMNAVFGKLLPFHPETARRFNFTPSVP